MARVTRRLHLRGYTHGLMAGRREASEAAAEHVLGVAQELVPLEEGPLQKSGRVVVSKQGHQAQIVFDTPYAVVQHENLDYQHAPGRQAKYLSTPMETEHEVCRQIMAAVLREYGRKGAGQ
jgi:hypothetical protein